MRQASLLLPLAALVLCSLAGCGGTDRRGSVKGVVKYMDKPLPGGNVVFVPEDKKMVERVPIQSDGTYSTSNLPFGKLNVYVEPGSKGGTGLPKDAAAKLPKDQPLPPQYKEGAPNMYVDFPAKYRNPETSGLSVTVDGSGTKTFDIDMTK